MESFSIPKTIEDGPCKFFGFMVPEDRAVRKRCQTCKKEDILKYKLCVEEADKILNTTILPGDGGESETEEETNMSDELVQGRANGVKEQVDQNSDEIEKASVKTPQKVVGVLDTAKSMLMESKEDGEIITKLISFYMSAGKTAKQSKHNAQSCLFNAKKKLGLSKTKETKNEAESQKPDKES
jgi:hypothetical protein